MQDYRKYFSGKRITLMGLGLLGRGVGDAKFLASLGAELIVTDLKTEEDLKDSLAQLKEFPNIVFHLGGHVMEDFQDRDLIIKGAGVPLDSSFIAAAKKNKIPVRMSADLFMELSGVASVGITGTRGKSTVTHLLAHILTTAGRHVLLGGNVQGVSTLALLSEVTSDTMAVLELDSWQTQGLGEGKLGPHIAVLTTFMPDHMNYYGNDMQMYFADKANIFLFQKPDDYLILGEQAAPFIKEYGYQNKILAHTVVAGAKDIPKGWQLKIPGEHNRYDAGIAAVVARTLGVDEGVIQEATESFPGVPGRLEFVREVRGVKIYNDTTATVPEATVAALEALGEKKSIVLIMGGADKMLNMSELIKEIPQYCKKVLLLAGTGTERIKKELPGTPIYGSITDATSAAFEAAEPGDIVLMSPAFASFGMFKNEYDRGEQFNTLVNALQE